MSTEDLGIFANLMQRNPRNGTSKSFASVPLCSKRQRSNSRFIRRRLTFQNTPRRILRHEWQEIDAGFLTSLWGCEDCGWRGCRVSSKIRGSIPGLFQDQWSSKRSYLVFHFLSCVQELSLGSKYDQSSPEHIFNILHYSLV